MSEARSKLLLALVLVGWFLLPGSNRPALALGALVGLLTAFTLMPGLGCGMRRCRSRRAWR